MVIMMIKNKWDSFHARISIFYMVDLFIIIPKDGDGDDKIDDELV